MTPSFLWFQTYVRFLPTGKETGRFLALDLGGTNFRWRSDLSSITFQPNSSTYHITKILANSFYKTSHHCTYLDFKEMTQRSWVSNPPVANAMKQFFSCSLYYNNPMNTSFIYLPENLPKKNLRISTAVQRMWVVTSEYKKYPFHNSCNWLHRILLNRSVFSSYRALNFSQHWLLTTDCTESIWQWHKKSPNEESPKKKSPKH